MTSIRHLLNYMVLKQFKIYTKHVVFNIITVRKDVVDQKSFIGHYAISGHKVIKNIASNHELLIWCVSRICSWHKHYRATWCYSHQKFRSVTTC